MLSKRLLNTSLPDAHTTWRKDDLGLINTCCNTVSSAQLIQCKHELFLSVPQTETLFDPYCAEVQGVQPMPFSAFHSNMNVQTYIFHIFDPLALEHVLRGEIKNRKCLASSFFGKMHDLRPIYQIKKSAPSISRQPDI